MLLWHAESQANPAQERSTAIYVGERGSMYFSSLLVKRLWRQHDARQKTKQMHISLLIP